MRTMSSISRIVGLLILIQIIGGISVNIFLTGPLSVGPGFLISANQLSSQLGLAVLVGLATSGISLAIAILLYPVFRDLSPSLAIGFISLAAIGVALVAVEHISLMSMVSYSQAYSLASGAQAELLESISHMVASPRKWAHYIGLIISGCTLAIFYGVLFRTELVPRILAGFGLAAVASQLVAMSLPLFGHQVIFLMLAPLLLVQIALGLWLLFKGLQVNGLKSR